MYASGGYVSSSFEVVTSLYNTNLPTGQPKRIATFRGSFFVGVCKLQAKPRFLSPPSETKIEK